MRKLRLMAIIAVGILCFTALTYAAIPRVINYQGKFTDKDDNPLSGNYLVTFRFYDTATEGKFIWEEGHILALKNGVFNALLGSIKPLEIDFDKDLWLGIEIASDGEMSPRIKLASSAYAFNAQTIDMLESSQLLRNDVDGVMSGTLTLKKDLVLKGDKSAPSKIVLTDGMGREYYLWMDNSGNLRLKQGTPASNKDGAIIKLKQPGVLSGSLKANIALILSVIAIVMLMASGRTKQK
ncbi:MAG: hypothetical protein KKD90_03670 [Candidatus Omnitrophica bacterium]|nr:hypothetical protein [Candidatus Omnitrophota bacterium]